MKSKYKSCYRWRHVVAHRQGSNFLLLSSTRTYSTPATLSEIRRSSAPSVELVRLTSNVQWRRNWEISCRGFLYLLDTNGAAFLPISVSLTRTLSKSDLFLFLGKTSVVFWVQREVCSKGSQKFSVLSPHLRYLATFVLCT